MPGILRATVLTLAALLSSCAGGGQSSSPAPQALEGAPDATPTIPVHILVLARWDGSGNPLWTRGYVEELLDTVTAMVGGTAVFALAQYETIADSRLYAGTQGELLPVARSQRRVGVLTIVISRPDTEDYAGLTDQEPRQGRPDPYLVMRSRHTTWDGINATAAILLHEVGHTCLGLYHQPEAFLDDGHPHTDNWTTTEAGLRRFETYLNTTF